MTNYWLLLKSPRLSSVVISFISKFVRYKLNYFADGNLLCIFSIILLLFYAYKTPI